MKQFFTAHYRTSQGGYAHAVLCLYKEGARQSYLDIQWQSDSTSRKHWYGCHAEARSESGNGMLTAAEQFSAAGKFLKQFPLRDDAVEYAGRLAAAGIELKWWDNRVAQFLKASEILAPEYRRWMVMNCHGNCVVSAISVSEHDAKIDLMKAMAKRIAEPCFTSMEQAQMELAQWVNDGKPVRLDTRAVAPELERLEILWTPLGIPEAIQEKETATA